MHIKTKSLSKRKILFLIIFIAVILFIGKRLSSDRSECDKWLYYHESGKNVNSLEEAISVFREFLPTEEKYKNHQLPTTLEGFKEKYNAVPFIREEKVTTKDGINEKKRVYDMLLAYAIGEDGAIYKYKMCAVI